LQQESKIIKIENLQEFVDSIKVNAFSISITKLFNNSSVFDIETTGDTIDIYPVEQADIGSYIKFYRRILFFSLP
jgi:hypothetical protein